MPTLRKSTYTWSTLTTVGENVIRVVMDNRCPPPPRIVGVREREMACLCGRVQAGGGGCGRKDEVRSPSDQVISSRVVDICRKCWQ